MKIPKDRNRTNVGRKPKIVAVNEVEQERRVEEAVAHRAYEIFQSHGGVPGHELEDWRQAETDLESPRCSGQMKCDGMLWVNTDVAMLDPGTIEIWVAHRKLTVCGKPRDAILGPIGNRDSSLSDREMIFHVIDLSCEVDPSQVTAKIDDALSLELLLRKADAVRGEQLKMEASAA